VSTIWGRKRLSKREGHYANENSGEGVRVRKQDDVSEKVLHTVAVEEKCKAEGREPGGRCGGKKKGVSAPRGLDIEHERPRTSLNR